MGRKLKLEDVFKNPEYQEKARQIQMAFNDPQADGHTLYKAMEDLLKRQGEWDFEQEILPYPYGLEIKDLGKQEFADLKETQIKEWIEARFQPSDYLIMPQNASGKYKDHWNWIYFKKKEQAALFKLVWG